MAVGVGVGATTKRPTLVQPRVATRRSRSKAREREEAFKTEIGAQSGVLFGRELNEEPLQVAGVGVKFKTVADLVTTAIN